jgi:oligopeptidase B
MMEKTRPLQKLLYKEFVSKLNEIEESAPMTLSDGWSYYSKYVI